MLKHCIAGFALALAPSVALADGGSSGPPCGAGPSTSLQGQMPQPQAQLPSQMHPQTQLPPRVSEEVARLPLPPGSRLVGVTEVDEIRALPELRGHENQGRITERVAGVTALDRVYLSCQPYAQTVSFFDNSLRRRGFLPLARTCTATSAAWRVRRPDGSIATLVVRNTSPQPTFETIEAVGEPAEIQTPGT